MLKKYFCEFPQNWNIRFFEMLRKMYKNIFKTCSYMQRMTPNPINALKIKIYNTKHTQNTKMYFQNRKNFGNKLIFQQRMNSKWSAFCVKFYGIIYIVYFYIFDVHCLADRRSLCRWTLDQSWTKTFGSAPAKTSVFTATRSAARARACVPDWDN